MSDHRHVRVLNALSDQKERNVTAVCLFAECPLEELRIMADTGLVRFNETAGGSGKRMQITAQGLDLLTHTRGGTVPPRR